MEILKKNIVLLYKALQEFKINIECTITKNYFPCTFDEFPQSLTELIKSYIKNNNGYLYFYKASDEENGFTEIAHIDFCNHNFEKATFYNDDCKKVLCELLVKFNIMKQCN